MTARKEGLERSHPVITLGRVEAERLIRPLFRSARVRTMELLGGGLGNSNYLVHLDDEAADPLVIRLHARGATCREFEVNLLRRLQGRVPVPRVLASGDDALEGTQSYLVLERCPGKTLNAWLVGDEDIDVPTMGRAVGRVLAAVGEISFDKPGLLAPDLKVKGPIFGGEHPYFDFIADCLFMGKAGRALGASLRERLWLFVSEHAEHIKSLGTERTLAHADFDGTNIILDRRDGEFVVTGVIDWEYAMSGPRAIDLSSILRYPENLPAGFEEALLDGFRAAGGTLSEPWNILARFVDMLAFCAFFNKDTATSRRRIFDMALRAMDGKLRALGY